MLNRPKQVMLCAYRGAKMSPLHHGVCPKCDRYCGCSFAPESMSDYCDTHRPAAATQEET